MCVFVRAYYTMRIQELFDLNGTIVNMNIQKCIGEEKEEEKKTRFNTIYDVRIREKRLCLGLLIYSIYYIVHLAFDLSYIVL